MAVQRRTTKKRKITTNVDKGVVHIHASFNNTLVTISDVAGNGGGGFYDRLYHCKCGKRAEERNSTGVSAGS